MFVHKKDKTQHDHLSTNYKDVSLGISKYKKYLKGKKIYCPCDSPESSQFWKYLSDNFDEIKPHSITSTYFIPNNERNNASMLIDGAIIDFKIQGDGSFDSKSCQELMDSKNVIITKPPHSEAKKFIKNLIEKDIKFLIACPSITIKNNQIFNLIKEKKVWIGEENHSSTFLDIKRNKIVSFSDYIWLTNIGKRKDNSPLELKKEYYGNENLYPKYDNIDAINVNKIKNIPKDYYGIMGVSINYLKMHCEEQFEIIDLTTTTKYTKEYKKLLRHTESKTPIREGGKDCYLYMKNKPDGTYYTAENIDGYLKKLFTKVLIQRRK